MVALLVTDAEAGDDKDENLPGPFQSLDPPDFGDDTPDAAAPPRRQQR